MLLSTFLSSLLGQALVSWTAVSSNYKFLFYISWIATSLGLASFALLPSPKRASPIPIFKVIKNENLCALLDLFCSMYKNKVVWIWTIGWIGQFGAYSIYSNYYQTQFVEHNHSSNGLYGLVNALMLFLSVIGSMIPVFIPCEWCVKWSYEMVT